MGNIDSVVVAQAPRLAAFITRMEENIAVALDTEQGAVNVKATTTEGLGFAGAGQGIASYAVAIVVKKLPG